MPVVRNQVVACSNHVGSIQNIRSMVSKDFVKQRLIHELEAIKAENSLVIVEGKNDKASLVKLGIINIFIINHEGKSLYESIEQAANTNSKEVVILTDLDKKGKKLYELIKSSLSSNGAKFNNNLRNLLLKLKISHVEGLHAFLEH